jgi:hypothetical protein
MEATPRATSRGRTNRERPVVTRHGLRSPHAATTPFRPMPTYTPFAKIRTKRLNTSPGQLPIPALRSEKSHSPSPRRSLRRAGPTITTAGQITKSPYTIASGPRVRAWAVFVRLTASENLHQAGRPTTPTPSQKADIRRVARAIGSSIRSSGRGTANLNTRCPRSCTPQWSPYGDFVATLSGSFTLKIVNGPDRGRWFLNAISHKCESAI